MIKKSFQCALLFCLFPYIIHAQAAFKNQVYEENIQTVRIYPRSGDFSNQLLSPTIPLNSSVPLVLEFDDIAYQADRYSAKIIHCNADWPPSGLKSAD